MSLNISKQRLFASLLILGACILLFRVFRMISQGAMDILVAWVSALLIAELIIDMVCLLSSIKWWIADDESKARIPLRTGASATILHAFRVLIYVIGRVGPWKDFDLRSEHQALHSIQWSWFWLYFAAILSVSGVIGVLIIWKLRRQAKKITL